MLYFLTALTLDLSVMDEDQRKKNTSIVENKNLYKKLRYLLEWNHTVY